MDFAFDARTEELRGKLLAFMDEHVHPAEAVAAEQRAALGSPWETPAVVEELKAEARRQGLWNLFLPDAEHGAGLTNLQYAPLAEITGRSPQLAPTALNCAAPDTGNMEVLAQFGDDAQKKQWLEPLLAGEIRSAFAMTEIEVASSDATNDESSIRRDGDQYVINGRKWFTSGVLDPRCKIMIVMGKTNPNDPNTHRQQSQILVPVPSAGFTVKRILPVFGYDEAPHGHAEVVFDNVRVPAENLLLGEGRGFEIAQGRLGPGRIHHCMRLIGLTERCLERMCRRAQGRTAFGKPISEQTVTQERVAEARIAIEQIRLLTLKAAYMMDKYGNKEARAEIAMIKVAAPNVACKVIDWAIQSFGAAGITEDYGLAYAYATARVLRLADGPDEVHRNQIAKLEFRKYQGLASKTGGSAEIRKLDRGDGLRQRPQWIA